MQDSFKQAQELIRAKNYYEAQQVLKAINHPKAEAWLQKVNEKLAEEDTGQFSLNLNETGLTQQYSPSSAINRRPKSGLKGATSFASNVVLMILIFIFLLAGFAAFAYGTFSLIMAEQGNVNPTFAVAWYCVRSFSVRSAAV